MVLRKIGKQGFILIKFFSLFPLLLSNSLFGAHKQSLTLSFFDERNHASKDAVVGERYRLEAKLCNVPVKNQVWPQVAGLSTDWIIGRQQRQEVSWLQGQKTESIYFVWEIVFNRPGVITIGPAHYIDNNGTTFQSPPLSITVREESSVSLPKQGALPSVSTFMRWEIDRLDPFVGEVVPVSLVFYTTDTALELESISEIQLEGGRLELAREPVWSSSFHNGISYKTVTWSGILVPKVPGILSMPIVTIAYREGVKSRSSSPWAMMHHMLSSFSPLHHKRSSVLSLQVRPLPPTDHLCIGVGKILSIIRASNIASLRSGEAGSITYRLQGSVHPNELQIPIPEVTGAPAKVYSSAYKSQGAYPHYDYEQEYVIHPQEEGVVRFEEQVLWYFDPKKEAYESYIVPDFELLVLENPSIKKHQEEPEPIDNEVKENIKLPVRESLEITEPFEASSPLKPSLPLSWFLLLLFVPCIFVIIKPRLYSIIAYIYRKLIITWITNVSLRRVKRATQRNDGYELLEVLRYFVSYVCDVSFDELSHNELVASCLIGYGMKDDQVNEWHMLWAELQKAAFGDKLSAQEYEILGNRCRIWIKTVYRFCVRKRGV